MKFCITAILVLSATLSSAQSPRPQSGQTTNGDCSPINNGNQNVTTCVFGTPEGTLRAVQQGNNIVITAVGGKIEPVSYGLVFDGDVTYKSGGFPNGGIMNSNVLRLKGTDGADKKNTIWLYWQSPALLPGRSVTVTVNSEKPVQLLHFLAVPFPQ